MLHRHGHRRVTVERSAAGEHFVHDDAQGVDIGRGTDHLALRLLGRIILNGAERHACGGQPLGAGILVDAGDAKIRQLDELVVVEHDVLRLDIAMDDATLVRGAQAKGHVVGNDDGALITEPAVALDVASQVGAFDVLHDDVVALATLAVVEHLDDVGVLQQRGRARLALEPRDELGVAAVYLAQDLDGDGAAHAQIHSAVDGGHSAAANGFLQFVAFAQNLDVHLPPQPPAAPATVRSVRDMAPGATLPRVLWHVTILGRP